LDFDSGKVGSTNHTAEGLSHLTKQQDMLEI